MILGIDPGASGALALLTEGGDLMDVADMPMIEVNGKRRIAAPLLAGIVRRWQPRLGIIEQVGAMPGQGVSSMFAFGLAAGIPQGVCAALDVPLVFAQPTVWKRALKVTKDKGACRQMAMRLWPTRADLFARVKDDGRAESALIAFYGRAQWQREAA